MQGAKVLGELAADKQCLVVLDDVWSLGVAQALAVDGPGGRLLLTTRDRLVLERLGPAGRAQRQADGPPRRTVAVTPQP